MKKASRIRWSFLLLSLALAPAGEGKETVAPHRDKALDYDVEVERVEVDVLVLDRDGNFVHGLSSEDFEIKESGRPVEIEDFELRSLVPEIVEQAGQAGQAALPAPAPVPRKFILFIDMLNCSSMNIQGMKPSLLRFVKEQLSPTDEILIAILTIDRRALILQTFTSARKRIVQAIEALRGSPENETRQARQEEEIYSLLYPGMRSGGVGSNDGNLSQILIRIQMATGLVRNLGSEENHRAVYSLNALASVLERVERSGWQTGRKTVIYVTDGLPLRPAQGIVDIVNRRIEEYNTLLALAAQTTANLQNLRAYPIESDHDLRAPLKKVTGRLNRVGATLYTLDARGIFHSASESAVRPRSNLTQGEQQQGFFENQNTLNALAVDTGGLAYFNRQNYDVALRDIERDNRLRYFLTYKPPKNKKDRKGKFHDIEVKCKVPRVSVRNRAGYID